MLALAQYVNETLANLNCEQKRDLAIFSPLCNFLVPVLLPGINISGLPPQMHILRGTSCSKILQFMLMFNIMMI